MTRLKWMMMALLIGMFGCAKNSDQKNSEHMDHSEHMEHADTDSSSEKPLKSPRLAAMANIGTNHVHIDYSAPSVRGRTIWGGLVAYDQVWVTGAHKATNINFNSDLKINDTNVPAGKYALFTIPGKDRWTVIINKNWDQHLTDDYDQADDILRFEVEPEKMEDNVEQLNYMVVSTGELTGQITISWEMVKITIDIESVE
jgi:hypothetical protein